ncbi:MAG TPA: hypothetical protein VHS78_11925 [Candidatus Elarobacter sp.]|jgi:hypothetical protein|nr:hypothetical protein [Candidatus Elarobacter sp.]
MMIRRSLTFVLAAALAALALPAAADDIGTVVIAKPAPDVLLLWDATPVVTRIVAEKTDRTAALQRLESSALELLAKRTTALKAARTLTVRVVYQKTGAVSPVYGTPTYEGVERVFELSGRPEDVHSKATAMERDLTAGRVPAGLHVAVSGALPPL